MSVNVKTENGLLMVAGKPYDGSYVTPQMFGAVGDGVHDDTEAFKSCILSMLDGDTLVVDSKSVLSVSDTIEISKNVNVLIYGEIKYTGVRNKPVLSIQGLNNKEIVVNYIHDKDLSVYHGFSNDDYCGIKFTNLWHCKVTVGKMYNFTTSIKICAVGGLSGGFVNNTFDIRQITNYKTAIEFVGDGKQSWINSNVFENVWLSQYSNESYLAANVERVGIKETFLNGCEFPHDTNVFNNAKFDCYGVTHGKYTAIKLDRAVNWSFNDYRLELNGANCFFCDLDTQYNAVQGIRFNPLVEFRTVVDNMTINVKNYGVDKYPISRIYEKISGYKKTEYKTLELFTFSGKHKRYADMFSVIDGWFALKSENTSIGDLNSSTGERTFLYGASGGDVNYPTLYENVRYLKNVPSGATIKVTIDEEIYRESYICFKGYDSEGNVKVTKCLNIDDYMFDSKNSIHKPLVNKSEVYVTACEDLSYVAILLFGKISKVEISCDNSKVILRKSYDDNRNKGKLNYAVNVPSLTDDYEIGDVLINAGTSSEAKAWKVDIIDNAKSWVSI